MCELWEEIKQEGKAEGEAIGEARGRAEGLAEGRVEGEEKRAIKSAKIMLEKNMSEDLIMEITGLDRDSINNLKLELA